MNTYEIIDKDILNFKQKAIDFYDYLNSKDFENSDSFIQRPYSYYMTSDFAQKEGLPIDNILNKSEYFTGDFRFFMTGPDHIGALDPHLDHFSDGIAPGVINLYLRNCDDSVVTKWWKIKKGKPIWIQNSGGDVSSPIAANRTPQFPSEGQFEVLEEKHFYDGEAHLFRTSRWHSVHNNSGKNRIICSFMLNPLMMWEDIVDNFKANGIIK